MIYMFSVKCRSADAGQELGPERLIVEVLFAAFKLLFEHVFIL